MGDQLNPAKFFNLPWHSARNWSVSGTNEQILQGTGLTCSMYKQVIFLLLFVRQYLAANICLTVQKDALSLFA